MKQYFLFCLLCLLFHVACGQYLGCYVDQATRDVPDPPTSFYPANVAGCLNYCHYAKGTKYAAIQNGNECRCGNSYGTYGAAPASDCNHQCTDDTLNACGGGYRNSIYKVSGDNYVGCFVDSASRDLPSSVASSGTIESCKSACSAAGFVYAGLQNGHECWCGNSYGNNGVAPENDCITPCSGSSSETCGAGYRNSVYRSGKNFPPKFNTLEGKTLFGFQGFFRAPGQGNGNTHWSSDQTTPNANNIMMDFWPDVSEIPAECRFNTGFTLPNGQNAQGFSSFCLGTIDTQFKWMQENGLDGVFAHRTYPDAQNLVYDNTKVLEFVRQSAEKYGRTFAIEFGISDDSLTDDLDGILSRDWFSTIQSVITSPNYLYHNGKPVISIWGCGVSISKASLGQCRTIVNHFREFSYLVLGVQAYWLQDVNQQVPDWDVYLLADVISPWTVGVYGSGQLDYPSFHSQYQLPDMSFVASHGVQYAPVIWAGSSWHNERSHSNNGNPPFNENPRQGGAWFQQQANSALSDKPFFVYLAMFDEFGEGTQYIPFVSNANKPTSGQFIGVDDGGYNVPSNHYLQIAGTFTKAFHQAKGV